MAIIKPLNAFIFEENAFLMLFIFSEVFQHSFIFVSNVRNICGAFGRGSVFLAALRYTIRTSGFVNIVTFAHNGQN